jgi:nicotinamidase-related amidase
MTTPSPAALLIIDVQRGLDDPKYGSRNNLDAEQRMADLLAGWRRAGWPVVHVQHMSQRPDSPLWPGLPGNALKSEVAPLADEPVFRKTVASAFIGTGLEAHLHDAGVRAVVLAGLTTDHCVSATARTASDLGFHVVVVEDATATHERTGPDGAWYSAEQMHRVALASLHGEFASVESSVDVLARFVASGAG